MTKKIGKMNPKLIELKFELLKMKSSLGEKIKIDISELTKRVKYKRKEKIYG
ncbi:MAG: hypothetical protein ACTSPI_00210 [Candidatus Heimdallarchaeaceae archaeon]